ncbi:glycoside hydrolase family 2 protein [Membranihabitans maritimus]|uniref:glycoside hydrolase family 2 protein n=1 Tax=Membranihabitans maritimus TaxID=2904244 RepID=UPI001F3231D3|nr:sugar-binding domain-containing protein [Membranihabitans maritimus]
MRFLQIQQLFIFLILIFLLGETKGQNWKAAGDKIKTRWGENLDPDNVLQEYPRPIMARAEWMNLNGLWEYAIKSQGSPQPDDFDGDILVPFPVESSLSGVMESLGKDKILWYEREFNIPDEWTGQKILLHFGAVDWKCEVWINDIKIGEHSGGYDPFSFTITPYLKTGSQKLTVKVWDPTDEGPQPRGKQVNEPHGIWYTPVSGIWQTVWLEPVNSTYITDIRQTPDIDKGSLHYGVVTENGNDGDYFEIIVHEEGTIVARQKAKVGEFLDVPVPEARLWSPEMPFLYKTEVKLFRNGEIVDYIESYFAMRKISMERDAKGIIRMQLNNQDYFQFGTLDQGWWPDGLYTAPSDEALRYDIEKTKELGFNMIRKHVKVEPARWYKHCDELGMLVWQDMPNGDEYPNWQMRKFFDGEELIRSTYSEKIYRSEWKEIMDDFYNYPSIVVWVPFNEGWGQFKTKEITKWTKNYDPSRLVNSASGGNHFLMTGDIMDLHHYPNPEMYLYDAQRTNVLGEYGGIGLVMKEHLWDTEKRNWGYVQYKSSEEVTDEYIKFGNELIDLVKSGFSGAIYTQTTDVEGEVNGLMTYDRKKVKVDPEKIYKINKEIINTLK